MKTHALLISLAVLALGLAIAFGDKHPDTSQEKLHCEMVQIWNETNGEYGWPDYNNTAGSCPKETQA
jgi:arabinogalactan endo-1,4-beta-galactosidase